MRISLTLVEAFLIAPGLTFGCLLCFFESTLLFSDEIGILPLILTIGSLIGLSFKSGVEPCGNLLYEL